MVRGCSGGCSCEYPFVCIRSSLHLVRLGQLLCCAHKRIVNICVHRKEEHASSIDMIPYKKDRIYSRLLLRTEKFNATRMFTLG